MLPVELIGVNFTTNSNFIMYTGKPGSWIKDSATLQIASRWNSQYRDILVLDANNKPAGMFNVNSPRTLENAEHRTTMTNLILAAATPADTDNDKLPDFWETNTYGNLDRTGASMDPTGITVLQRYALGLATTEEGRSRIFGLPDGTVSLVYNRRRGKAFGLTVLPRFSRNLSIWDIEGHGWEEWSLRTLYDGSGSEVVEWKILTPGEWRFARVHSTLP